MRHTHLFFLRSITVSVVGSALVFGFVVHADEVAEERVYTEEAPVQTTEEFFVSDESTPEETASCDDIILPTSDDVNAREIDGEMSADIEFVVGEVTALARDGSILLDTEDDELLHIASSTLRALHVRRLGREGRVLTPCRGDLIMLMSGTVMVTPAVLETREGPTDISRTMVFFIATRDGREQLPIDPSTPIYRDTFRVNLDAVKEGDAAVAIRSESGSLLALDIDSSGDDPAQEKVSTTTEDVVRKYSEMPLWVWGLAIVVFILLGIFLIRR